MAFLHTTFHSLRSAVQCAGKRTGPTLVRSLHSSRCNAAVFSNADKQTLSEVLNKSDGRVVLVDFYADWCPPCRILSPILEKYSAEPNTSANGTPVDLVKIDTETVDGQQLSSEQKIKALPTVLVYKGGNIVERFTGALPEGEIKRLLDNL